MAAVAVPTGWKELPYTAFLEGVYLADLNGGHPVDVWITEYSTHPVREANGWWPMTDWRSSLRDHAQAIVNGGFSDPGGLAERMLLVLDAGPFPRREEAEEAAATIREYWDMWRNRKPVSLLEVTI